ncbi:hypothetical protein D3C76_1755940 [compost metagenome]
MKQGVRVWGSERFQADAKPGRFFARIASCSPGNEEQLRKGLEVAKELLGRANKTQEDIFDGKMG